MHFYPGLDPDTIRRLTLRERNALVAYMNKVAERVKTASG